MSTREPAADGLPADRTVARVRAHAVLEQIQVAPDPGLLDRLQQQAHDRGWAEVEVLLLYCRLLAATRGGASDEVVAQHADTLLQAAKESEQDQLLALALAARSMAMPGAGGHDVHVEDVSGDLARAVALLDELLALPVDELGDRVLELPAGYVECGQAYARVDLWELEERMYARAAASLDLPVPEHLRCIGDFTRRVLPLNRLESRAALACALIEIGQTGQARQVAAGRVRPTPAELATLPPIWVVEVQALERLLSVVAGEDVEGGPTAVPARLVADLAASTWTGYHACVLLAAAIGWRAEGRTHRAATLAAQAATLLDEYLPSLRTLALALAAEGEGDGAGLRYARDLAGRRWRARLQVLGAAKARLAAEEMLQQGETLTRHAYRDALTGLSNRHDLDRHLSRLRGAAADDAVAVILVDLDHFKTINDTFGHAVGDEVLRTLGTTLLAAVRPSDVAVRLGGDEFLLLLSLQPTDTDDDVVGRAHDVVAAVAAQAWQEIAPGLAVTVSAGVASGPACDVDTHLHIADANLYEAKRNGRGRAADSRRP